MLSRHFASTRRFGLWIDSDGCLKRRRAIDVEEHRLAQRFLRVAPTIEDMYDLLGHLLLERQERIILRDRLAVLFNSLGGRLYCRHPGILAAERLILQTQRMQIAHR